MLELHGFETAGQLMFWHVGKWLRTSAPETQRKAPASMPPLGRPSWRTGAGKRFMEHLVNGHITIPSQQVNHYILPIGRQKTREVGRARVELHQTVLGCSTSVPILVGFPLPHPFRRFFSPAIALAKCVPSKRDIPLHRYTD